MSLIRLKQINTGELADFFDSLYSGDQNQNEIDLLFIGGLASGTSGNLNTLSGRVEAIAVDLGVTSGIIFDYKNRVDELSGDISQIIFDFDTLSGDLDDINLSLSGRITTLSGDLATLNSEVDSLTNNILENFSGVSPFVMGLSSGTGVAEVISVGRGLSLSGNILGVRAGNVLGQWMEQVDTEFIISGQTATNQIDYLATGLSVTSGVEVITCNYTPLLSNSTLWVDFNGIVSAGTQSGVMTSALFLTSPTTGSLAASAVHVANENFLHETRLRYKYLNASTTEKTFSVRCGPSSAITGYVNRNDNSILGGYNYITLSVTEIAN